MTFSDSFLTDADEIKQRETAQLVAELAVLGEYDSARSRMGHDYGSGQRNSEFARRIRELRARGVEPAVIDQPSDFTEPALFVAAFEKIGVAKMRRAESETYRSSTPSTSRTLRAWRMVGMLAEQKRQLAEPVEPAGNPDFEPIVEPPASTEEAVESVAAQLRERSEKRAARDAAKAERKRQLEGLAVGDFVHVVGSREGGVERSYTGTIRRLGSSGTVLVDDARETDGAGTPTLHYSSSGSIFKIDRYSWRYDPIARGGGEKWSLVEHRSYGEVTIATLVRLPGTMTRIFRAAGQLAGGGKLGETDHVDACEARLVLCHELGFELPRIPNRSDADHARAAERRRSARSSS